MPKPLCIMVDISDWADPWEHRQLRSAADVRTLLVQGHPPAEVARRVLVWQARGLAEDDLLPPWPNLLQTSAMQAIRWRHLRGKSVLETPGGSALTPNFIGLDPASATAETDYPYLPGFADVHSPRAQARARTYLERVVPGHIRGRLAILAANGGDVHQAAEDLKAVIDAQVVALTGQGSPE